MIESWPKIENSLRKAICFNYKSVELVVDELSSGTALKTSFILSNFIFFNQNSNF